MRKNRTGTIVLTCAAALAAIAVFLPLWWVFASSLRPGNTYVKYTSPLSWLAFIPIGGDFSNYVNLLQGPFVLGLVNSFIVAGATILFGLAIAIPAAYALATIDFPGKKIVFSFIILVAMVPFDAIAIPLSGLFQNWGLSDSYAGLILPALANGFAIFVLRQFFLGIPGELLDAAEVDGLGRFATLWYIVLPLSRPAMIGAAMMLFLSQWAAYLWPLLIGTSPERQLAPIALANLSTMFTVDLGQILAGSFVLSIIPMIL
ncbi:carbohydrate ABC transporter permease, partial [uncultured Microbacterium sp.]